MRFRPAVLLGLLVAASAKDALAWGGPGHMQVAGVAWNQMTPAAKATAWDILQKHPYFETWTKQLGSYATKPDKERYYFMISSTWPDFIKGDEAFGKDNKPAPTGPVLPGFPDMWRHTDWHYTDSPYALYPQLEKEFGQVSPPSDAEAQVPVLDNLLKDATKPEARGFALPWLIHIVGDLHQPLHAASRYTKFDVNAKGEAKSDLGGNKMKVSYEGKEWKLHGLWDDIVGRPAVVSFEPYVEDYFKDMGTVEASMPVIMKKIGDRQVKAWAQDMSPGRWRLESYNYAVDNIYAVVGYNLPNQPLPVLSPKQGAEWQEYGYKRVAAAGIRLAALLNSSLAN